MNNTSAVAVIIQAVLPPLSFSAAKASIGLKKMRPKRNTIYESVVNFSLKQGMIFSPLSFYIRTHENNLSSVPRFHYSLIQE
jgi:hypothetical protein